MPFLTAPNGVRYYQFESFPAALKQAVFTRQGGLSPAPWQSLNFGNTVGDERPRVRQNRHLAFEALGRNPASMFDVFQVHSADVVLVNAPHPHFNNPPELRADAMLTDNPRVTLLMRFADCTPILLYDPRRGVAGIAHAGWLGTVRKAAARAVEMMRAAYGCRPADILAAIGPAIGPDHYEIGADVEEHARYAFGRDAESVLERGHGPKAHFNLWAANQLVLRQAGVEQVEIAGICTACHTADWYSHRAEKGQTGRFGALIALPE
ncbi:MAG: peptidoglycan editing factor PgeF [Anaerolineales bacterium]